MPATSRRSNSNFATQDLIAIFHRMVVVAPVRFFSVFKDPPFLVDVGELEVRNLLVEKSSRRVSFP